MQESWAATNSTVAYVGYTLQTDGLIHFSKPEQLLHVANDPDNPFLDRTDLILLYADPTKLHAELRYEVPKGEHMAYPHLYGPLNIDAVCNVVPFVPTSNGLYPLPEDIQKLKTLA